MFFEVDSARPLALTFSFTPEMLRMWPAPNFGRPSGEWVKDGDGGFYVLHTDNDKFSAAIAMPRTQPGIMVPYQEHPQTFPLELKLSFDPKRDRGLVFPLLMTLTTADQAREQIAKLYTALQQTYTDTYSYYAHFFDKRLTIETPDQRINDGLRWAEIAIDQAQVKTAQGETGMVAGYYESADSARPGYAWFFGRDTLWSTYAINSYGDYGLTRRALDFLIHRQRADGKIMHEYSQAAESIDWKATPYFYASADSTPLLLMAGWDYTRKSGDSDYLKANWEAFKKAYAFTRAHEGNDGIYSNSEGTGWVESWPSGMPQEEIYLASLDEQANVAMSQLSTIMNEPALALQAGQKAHAIHTKIEAEFHNSDFYAFSRNQNGTLDETATIYPAVAWWDSRDGLANAGPMLSRWASSEFSTDWGARDISEKTPFYDPISYHQGSVWPLFTGWVALAEYRAGQPLAGYASLMQNLNLTWAQDLGSVTELLSGEFFQPLGRSSSHQLVVVGHGREPSGARLVWSGLGRKFQDGRSESPFARGMGWSQIAQLTAGNNEPGFRNGTACRSAACASHDKTARKVVHCHGSPFPCKCESDISAVHTVMLPLPAVEIGISAQLPEPGERTRQLKVLSEEMRPQTATFIFEGQAGSTYDLPLQMNKPGTTVDGASIGKGKLHLEFPTGEGYVEKTVTFKW